MKFLIVLLLGLVLTSSNALGSNAAFPSNGKLNRAESVLAGHPSTVWCSSTAYEWDTLVRAEGFPGGGSSVDAFVRASNLSEVLSGPSVCRTTYYALRVGQAKVRLPPLGRAINVLTHEAQHLRGIRAEDTAEACAKLRFATMANVLLGVKYYSVRMRAIVNSALYYSSLKAPKYQGGRCS